MGILFVIGPSEREVPDSRITAEKPVCGGLEFAVVWEPVKLMHTEFEIYKIVIVVSGNPVPQVRTGGYIEVWNAREFLYASEIPIVNKAAIPDGLRGKITSKETLLFTFSLNPRFLRDNWFNYQVTGKDGAVEVNCLVRLGDFIRTP